MNSVRFLSKSLGKHCVLGSAISGRNHKQNFSSSADGNDRAKAWLKRMKYSDAHIQVILDSLERDLSTQPSVSLLKTLGEKGIARYLKSIEQQNEVQREKESHLGNPITVHVNSPHSHQSFPVTAYENQNLYDTIRSSKQFQAQVECACGGVAACSTCHIYVDNEYWDALNPIEQAELDMLDLAAEVRPNSRLSCQIVLNSKCDGITFTIPSAHNDLFAR